MASNLSAWQAIVWRITSRTTKLISCLCVIYGAISRMRNEYTFDPNVAG